MFTTQEKQEKRWKIENTDTRRKRGGGGGGGKGRKQEKRLFRQSNFSFIIMCEIFEKKESGGFYTKC